MCNNATQVTWPIQTPVRGWKRSFSSSIKAIVWSEADGDENRDAFGDFARHQPQAEVNYFILLL